ncbi:hypothetical protein [Aliarcobacter skirrowii]|uniref:hypothetical protein n=1 Tax=Aliarcobacter skirrowii TaxID=28200 RepID=UPI0029B5C960|nr:hypothetical protein [Aliarcobacter skirrowii]MDX4036986.1 hypothetical protein [Aliarcobacter skirrowii]MDX4038229.1 hypothetical protein [Aliarcobacter skirrowii]
MFKKIISSFIIFFAMNSSAMSFNTDTFVGVGTGLGFVKQSEKGGSKNEDGTDTSTLLILKAGVVIEDFRRVSFIYNPSYLSGTRINTFLGAFDYILPIDYSRSKLFLGAHLGFTNVEKKSLEGSNATDFVYGAQFGILNDIAHNLELEIGTKFTKYDIDKNYKENGADVKYKLDRAIDFYATINYRF